MFFGRAGGKSRIAGWIVRHLPKGYADKHYIEPFFGGGAVFFKKTPSKIETVNDIDSSLMNFWKVMSDPELYKELKEKVDKYLHFQEHWKECKRYLKDNDPTNKVQHAYCYWVFTQASFSYSTTSYGYTIGVNSAPKPGLMQSKISFFDNVFKRFKKTQIFSENALNLIKRLDNVESIFYLDPPYPETRQDAYRKNTFGKEQFMELLQILRCIKGKFMLSCYQKEWMKLKGWNVYKKKTLSTVAESNNLPREETLITNFKQNDMQIEMI